MKNSDYLTELGRSVQEKNSRDELRYHFANCNVDDAAALGEAIDAENGMWARMLEKAYWAPLGGTINNDLWKKK